MNIIVFSVNTGGYDELKNPVTIDKNVRYILFTDNKNFKSDIWEVNHIDHLSYINDNRRIARYIKINSHLILPNHDVSVWIDHCYKSKVTDFAKLIKDNPFNNILCYKHNERKCIYEESKKILQDRLDYPDLVNKQMDKYRKELFPINYGLFDSGFTIRKNNDSVKLFNDTWWNEIKNGSARDQLSQVYSSWKTKTPIDAVKVGRSVYENPYLSSKIKHPNRLHN